MADSDKEVYEIIDKIEGEVQKTNGVKEDQLLTLLREIAVSQHDTGGALRTVEICELTGWSPGRVRRQLHKLKSQGKIEAVRVQVESLDSLDGYTRFGTAYRIRDDGAF
jgi:hypothetical protein